MASSNISDGFYNIIKSYDKRNFIALLYICKQTDDWKFSYDISGMISFCNHSHPTYRNDSTHQDFNGPYDVLSMCTLSTSLCTINGKNLVTRHLNLPPFWKSTSCACQRATVTDLRAMMVAVKCQFPQLQRNVQFPWYFEKLMRKGRHSFLTDKTRIDPK